MDRPSDVSAAEEDRLKRKPKSRAARDSRLGAHGFCEERFRVALRGSPVTVFTHDRDLRYTWVFNSCGVGTDTDDEIVGKTDAELLPLGDAARLTAIKRRVLDTGEPARGEIWLTNADGSHCFDYWFNPLRDGDGRVLGLACASMDVTESAKVRQEIERMKADLERRVDARTSKLRRLAAKLTSAQDTEQRRLAQGLHDDVAQLLMAVGLKLAMARRAMDEPERSAMLDQAERLLGETNAKVRSLSFEFGSSVLYSLGVPNALGELCKGMEERYGVHFEFRCLNGIGRLDDVTATVLFKASRELLFNVVKHAGVKDALLTLERDDHSVRLSVEDRGKGFAVSSEGNRRRSRAGLGLIEIHERLGAIGGRMEIESEPGIRTRVTLWASLRRDRSRRRSAGAIRPTACTD